MLQSLESILFPQVCDVCGNLTVARRMLCDYCIEHAFEPANPEHEASCPGHIPPDFITVQDALWKYDKKGHLQSLLIKLKYNGQRDVGRQCGKLLGRKLLYSQWYDSNANWKLVPVPLHWLKYWKRGYNQATEIAIGFSEETEIPLSREKTVQRNKFTRTQTGFSLERRLKNIQGAFTVSNIEDLRGHNVIIIDDVFTTGATTYQLAENIFSIGVNGIFIYTIGVA